MPSPKKKVTLYFSATMLEETQREAIRQDRSISWIIQAAWRKSRDEVHKLPGAIGVAVGPDALRVSPELGVPSPDLLDLAPRSGAAAPPAGARPPAHVPPSPSLNKART